jgi:hypothetical protein
VSVPTKKEKKKTLRKKTLSYQSSRDAGGALGADGAADAEAERI